MARTIQDSLPKSRITLKYKTEVNGQKEDMTLPFRMLVAGDFSKGTSEDRKLDLEEREMRALNGKNLDATMKKMDINLNLEVENKVNPDKEGELNVSLPITSMKSFSPDEVVKHVPKVQSLMKLREYLTDLQSSIDNKKGFKKAINQILTDPEAVDVLKKELDKFGSYQLPEEVEDSEKEAGSAASEE